LDLARKKTPSFGHCPDRALFDALTCALSSLIGYDATPLQVQCQWAIVVQKYMTKNAQGMSRKCQEFLGGLIVDV